MSLFPSSVRAKLTLTAVAVMGLLFVLLGAGVEIAGRQQIMSSVDGELARRAAQIIRAHKDSDREMRPPDGVPPPMVYALGQDRGPRGGNRPGENPPNDNRPGDNRRGNPPDQQGNRGPQGGGPPPNQGGGPDGPGGGGRRFGGFLRRLRDIGDPTLAVGPRFIVTNQSPPIAPPEMREPYDKGAVALAKVNPTVYSTVYIGNGELAQKMRLITQRAKDEDGREWVLQVPYPLGEVDKALATLSTTLLVILPFGLLLLSAACLFLMSRLMRPIREIASTTASINAEELSGRLSTKGTDEFSQLAATINAMLGRLEDAFRVQKLTMEQLEAVLKQQRRFTADASHELKTPLAVIKANTGIMLHGSDLSEDARSQIEAVDAAAGRMNRLVQGLMALAKADSGSAHQSAAPFDLKLTVQNAIDQVHHKSTQSVSYSDDGMDGLVNGSERDIERVFVNLIDNACRYIADDGHVEVQVERHLDEAIVTVRDNGLGIAPEHLPHLFERFYRADASRSTGTGGTGLGLAICKSIVESVKGSITIESEVGRGTTVTVLLPLSS